MTPAPASIPRRHDLDALRGTAMLLGIALHAASSFIPTPGAWPVTDVYTSQGYAVFMAMIHGFRMPLFFILSGFFTAMLWRKRGLPALLYHRFLRIFVPLVVGMVTIVPAVWIVGAVAQTSRSARAVTEFERATDPESRLFFAASNGDVEGVRKILASDVDVNHMHAEFGAPPLLAAASNGHGEVVHLLLEHGADPNARSDERDTSLHIAALFGYSDVAQQLLEHDAIPDARNAKGQTPLELTELNWGITQWVAGMIKVRVDETEVMEGRKEVVELINQRLGSAADADAVLAASNSDQSPQVDAPVDDDRNPGEKREDGMGELAEFAYFLLFRFPVFHHLWFLAFLCWLVLGFAVYAKVMEWLASSGAPKWLVVSPWRYAWLIPLTLLPQAMMGEMYPVFGPDTSVGLLPMPHVLFYYALFFGFGALYFDANDDAGVLGRWWKFTMPLCLIVLFPVGYELTLGEFGVRDTTPWLADNEGLVRGASLLIQVAYAWLMSFAMIGLFRSCMSGESKTARYLSDSSYWLYLAHLPLIMLAQILVQDWTIPSLVKFALINLVVGVVLLISYQYCVRYTAIGTMLNGPRKRPGPIVLATAVEAPE